MEYIISNQVRIEDESIQETSLDACIDYLSSQKVIGLDIETTRKYNKYFDIEGLDPYTSSIVMLQVGDLEHQFVIDTRNVDITPLLPILMDPEILKVGHNLKFEYKHILHNYNVRIEGLYDTMIAEQILFNGIGLSNSLKDLNERYLGIIVDKSTRLEFLSIGSKPFTSRQIKYGAEDILNPLKIREVQKEELIRKDLVQTFKLEIRFLSALAEIEYNGINFNKEKWLVTYEKNLELYLKQVETLNKFVISNFPKSEFIDTQLDLFSTELKCKIQWSSSKQVIPFFLFLGICPQAVSKTTKKLSYTVEAKEVKMILVKQQDLDPLIKEFITLYLTTKELEQATTTFGKGFLKNVNPITGRIHSNYNQILNTGRISSRSPNNQNIPAKHDFRYAFDAPEGKDMVNADYSGQENIILVNKSLDPDLLTFYDDDLGDMHSYIAKKLFPEDLKDVSLENVKHVRKDLRQIAKSAGFALAYGGNGFTIANNLGISEARGEEVYEAYFEAFPGLKNYFEREKTKSLLQGYILIDDLTRRKFYFKDHKKWLVCDYRGDFRTANNLKGKMERASQNYVIQGEAGSITKFATVLLHEWIKAENLWNDVKVVLLVHDEIVLESSKHLSGYVAEKLQFNMEKAGAMWCKRVPLKAEAVISSMWEH